jgi:hypothetical protein
MCGEKNSYVPIVRFLCVTYSYDLTKNKWLYTVRK